MITRERVKLLLEEKIAGTDKFIVNLDIKPGNKILVEIDSDEGLTIDDCVEISRHVERNLDREEEDFDLKVSSPGLDRPLRVVRQYQKNKGREIVVNTTSGEKFEGELLNVSKEGIELLAKVDQKGKKQKEKKIIPFKFDEIKEAKIKISFKK